MITHCHREDGCIREEGDETCGDEGNCSIVLNVIEERERCAKLVEQYDLMFRFVPETNTGDATYAFGATTLIAAMIRQGENK